MDTLIQFIDGYIIGFYRITGAPLFDYFLGTFLVALISVIVGEFSISLAFRINRGYINSLNRELIYNHNLSIEAMSRRDDKAYNACNRLANDSFGRVFFHMIALSAASLWPVFFALAWMQPRFGGIELPLPWSIPFLGESVGYVFLFFLMYILARVFFGSVKNKLPYFRDTEKLLEKQSLN